MGVLKRLRIALAARVALLLFWVAAGAVVFSPEYVYRTLKSRESSVEDYLDEFPLSPLSASAQPFTFSEASSSGAAQALETVFDTDDLEGFLTDTEIQAIIVIEDDTVLYEGYGPGFARDSMATSFSVAKSFDSALVGMAIDEGFISSVDDPVTDYLPELLERDPAFAQISVEDLLLMASGLDYKEFRWWLFNGDDPLTTYYPDQCICLWEGQNREEQHQLRLGRGLRPRPALQPCH